mmetsp:Transcript_36099/g.58262  ORF Transcript_36099/g.58262 Transcript_36099/m.58262 type:complete len:392 (-) Transcript_36099:95-1270(-)
MQAVPGANRPGTAPVRRPPGRPEVARLVQDLLGSVASTACSSSCGALATELPRRPHTACAGAQAVVVESSGAQGVSDDDESDGGSLDPYDDDEALELLRSPSAVPATLISTGPSSRSEVLILEDSLSRGERLLLSGGFFGSTGAASSSPRPGGAPKEVRSGRGSGPEKRTALPDSTAEKLPRRCLLLSGRSAAGSAGRPNAGMAPRAARLKSHNSWANFMPMRKTVSLSDSIAAVSSTASPKTVSSTGISPLKEVEPLAPAVEEQKLEANTAAELDGLAGLIEQKKQPGPKFRVLPGSSRPALASGIGVASDAKREFVVLEFRTEPRVVPASRRIFGKEANPLPGGRAGPGPILCSSKSGKGFTPLPRFRQDSRQWAIEREALAARAGGQS